MFAFAYMNGKYMLFLKKKIVNTSKWTDAAAVVTTCSEHTHNLNKKNDKRRQLKFKLNRIIMMFAAYKCHL